jgi:hypothetical protein
MISAWPGISMTIRGSTGRIPSCVGDAVRYRTEYVGVQGPNLLEGDIDALVDAARDATLLDLTEEQLARTPPRPRWHRSGTAPLGVNTREASQEARRPSNRRERRGVSNPMERASANYR